MFAYVVVCSKLVAMQNPNVGALKGGQSLQNLFIRKYKLIGLNKPWKAGGFNGYYATIQTGKDDGNWFHSGFDETFISVERQAALFDMFKKSVENLWSDKNHLVVVKCDKFSDYDGTPSNPIIIDLKLDL
jgi:hypothetical protein